MKRMGNVNGDSGHTGSLQTDVVVSDVTIVEAHGGHVLEVDPAAAGGSITFTLLATTPGRGFFVELCQVSAGTVTVAAGPGASLDSPGGLANLGGQWSTATLRRRDADGRWALSGDLA